jgi:DNA primase
LLRLGWRQRLGFLMDYENLDFPGRWRPSPAAPAWCRGNRPWGTEEPDQEQSNKALYALMEQVASWYRQHCGASPQASRAVDYLKSRGLTGAIARQFDRFCAPAG